MTRTVLVTGASSGIGQACARAFAAAGDRLILVARRRDRLEALAVELEEAHGTASLRIALDVREREVVSGALDPAALDAAALGAAALGAAWSEVDVLVNGAGLAAGQEPLPGGDPADWDRMLDTNVKGTLWVTRAVVPGMVARGRGHVINLGSVAGRETYPSGAVYCASKSALDSITRGLRMDVLGSGVRVSTVDPGLVETEFSVVRFDGDEQRAADVYTGMTPLTPEDVAESILWVADRPPHVVVADMVLFPVAQAAARMVHREHGAG
jgi:3-hydroxy acid dehydrogenase / malonic semialdehyde reductase